MLERLKAYLELMKPFHHSKTTLYYGFCSLAGTLWASSNPPLTKTISTAIAITLAAFAIYALNDICDVEIDRINAPERPLPSGRVGELEAEVLTIGLFASALAIAHMVDLKTLIFTALFSILGVIYSLPPIRLKDGWFANICWGLGIGMAILSGASFIAISPRPIIVAATLALLTAGCGFTKDLKDMEGDKALGIRTIPIVLGERKAVKLMAATFVGGMPLLFLASIFYGFNLLYLSMVTVATIIFAYSLLVLYKHLGEKDLYKRAYKMQAASGMFIMVALILAPLI